MTPEMRRTLTVIQEYHAAHGVAPTFREIMKALDLKSKAPIHRRVHALIDRGYLVKLPGRDRAYVPATTVPDLTSVPADALRAELAKRERRHG